MLFGLRGFFGFVEVRVVKKPGEQQQVTKVHQGRHRDIDLGHPARLRATGLQVTVRDVVDETANQHLSQLTGRDEHGYLLGHPVTHGAGRVIQVHYRVHRVVHDNEPPGGRRKLRVREPRIQQHGDVMVPVQKDERFLAHYHEYGIEQFGQLGQDEHPRPEPGHLVIYEIATNGTENLENSVRTEIGHHLRMNQ